MIVRTSLIQQYMEKFDKIYNERHRTLEDLIPYYLIYVREFQIESLNLI